MTNFHVCMWFVSFALLQAQILFLRSWLKLSDKQNDEIYRLNLETNRIIEKTHELVRAAESFQAKTKETVSL